MSINTNREAARLAMTTEALKSVRAEIKNLETDIENGCAESAKFYESMTGLRARIRALEDAKQAARMRLAVLPEGEERNLDVQQVTAADESIVLLVAELDAAAGVYNQMLLAKDAALAPITAKLTTACLKCQNLEERHALQTLALERQAAREPRLVARHIRKCRRYGWADNRLGAKK